MGLRDIAVLVFFIGSLPVCFFRPFYGILLWNVVAFLNPQRFAFGAASNFPLALAVAIPTLAGAFVFGRGWRQLRSREVMLIVVLWLWFTFTSEVAASTPMFATHIDDTWFRWGVVSKILLMTLVAVSVVDSFARLRILVLVIAGCLAVFVLKDLPFMIATGGSFRLYGPPDSMIADNNDFGLALNMVLPLFLFLGRTESNRRVRALMYFLALATIPAIFFTYSRGALLGLGVVAIIAFFRLRRRWILIPVLTLALLTGLFLAPQSWQDRMSSLTSGNLDSSAMSRINAWTFSWRLASDFPITGGGFETFTPELFQRYAPTTSDVHGPHSIYFGVLGEHGFPGLLLYLLLVLSCLTTISRLVKLAQHHGDQRAADYANMFRLSLTGFLTSGLFLGRAYFDLYFSIVACIVVLNCVCRREWSKSAFLEDAQSGEEQEPVHLPSLTEERI